MQTALINTMLGMGTVFIVLIFISFIISLFAFIPVIAKKFRVKKESKNTTETPVPAVEKQVSQPVLAESEDETLIAVIAAAVAAAMSESTGVAVAADGLVIRSIKRRR